MMSELSTRGDHVRIDLTIEEGLALAGAVRRLPAMVLGVRSAGEAGEAVEVDLDPARLPGTSGAMKLGAALAGRVTVTARFLEFSGGDATFALAAQARGLTVDRVLNHLTGRIAATLAAQGLPPDVVELRAGADGPLLVAHAQAAADARVSGAVVQAVDLRGGTVRVELALPGEIRPA